MSASKQRLSGRGSLAAPEPPPKPPVLSSVHDASGRLVATLARRPGAASAILRDAQGRMRTLIDSENPALEAARWIKQHPEDFQPSTKENQCDMPSAQV